MNAFFQCTKVSVLLP